MVGWWFVRGLYGIILPDFNWGIFHDVFRIRERGILKCGGVHQRILGFHRSSNFHQDSAIESFQTTWYLFCVSCFFFGGCIYGNFIVWKNVVCKTTFRVDLVSRATCIIIQMIFSLASTDVFVEVKLGEYEIGGLARFYRGKVLDFLDVLTILTVCLWMVGWCSKYAWAFGAETTNR